MSRRHRRHPRRALSGLSGLAGLATRPSKDAMRVVGAFVLGKTRVGSCKVPKKGEKRSDSDCNYRSDGVSLMVKGTEIASRVPLATSAKEIKVCPGEIGKDVESGKAAGAIMAVLGTGIGFQNRGGKRYLRGAKKVGRVEAPSGCFTVDVTGKVRTAAMRALKSDVTGSDYTNARLDFEKGNRQTMDSIDRDIATFAPRAELEVEKRRSYKQAAARRRKSFTAKRAKATLRLREKQYAAADAARAKRSAAAKKGAKKRRKSKR